MIAFLFFSLVTARPAMAAHSDSHIFFCVVNSFDQKIVKGNCDPSKPKRSMVIPREWIGEDQVLKVNKPVKFAIDSAKFERWMAMNQPTKKGK